MLEKLTEKHYQDEIVRLHGLCDVLIDALKKARRLLRFSGVQIAFIDDIVGVDPVLGPLQDSGIEL